MESLRIDSQEGFFICAALLRTNSKYGPVLSTIGMFKGKNHPTTLTLYRKAPSLGKQQGICVLSRQRRATYFAGNSPGAAGSSFGGSYVPTVYLGQLVKNTIFFNREKRFWERPLMILLSKVQKVIEQNGEYLIKKKILIQIILGLQLKAKIMDDFLLDLLEIYLLTYLHWRYNYN